jgi:hypothetical protein
MATTKSDILTWIKRAEKEGARWLIVACDTYDNSDYPIAFKESEKDECIKKIKSIQSGQNMQRLMEVYDLNCSIERQLNQKRAMMMTYELFSPTDGGKHSPTVNQIVAIKALDKIKEAGGPVQAVINQVTKENSLTQIWKEILDGWTDEERLALISCYCKHCGSKDTNCKCWDDT